MCKHIQHIVLYIKQYTKYRYKYNIKVIFDTINRKEVITIKFDIDIFEDDYNVDDFRKDIVNNISLLLYKDLKDNLKNETELINNLINKRISDVLKNDIRNMVQKQVNDKISDIYSYIDRVKLQ